MKKSATKNSQPEKKRAYVSQEDIPARSLTEALAIATTLHNNFGKDPASPLRIAGAMELAPGGSEFRMVAGASIAYGLTDGGYNANAISIQPLGQRIVKPMLEGDDLTAKREAFLKPKLIKAFLTKYHSSPLPKTDIGCNVLEDMGVPKERSNAVLTMITDGAKELGLLQDIKGKFYVDIAGVAQTENPEENGNGEPNGKGAVPLEAIAVEKTKPLVPLVSPPVVEPPATTPKSLVNRHT